jgi:hypothetical protein
MLHMPCQMQEMHKGKLYICYKGAPTHPTQEIKHTPSSRRKRVKVAWSRGLMKISASWSCVGTWIKGIFHFSMLSLRKWYLTSMCLVLEWSIGFFATLMALVLSHWSGIWVYSSPKSLMVYEIQRSWEQQLVAATYSASVVDWATLDCLQEDQDIKEEPKNWQVPEVDFYPADTWQNPRLKNHEAPKKRTRSTKGRSRECDASTWKFASPLADAKSSETLENQRTDILRIGWPASSPSSRGVTRSCSSTPFGPRVHLPCPHQQS